MIKLTKNDIVKSNGGEGKRKLTKSDVTFDTTPIGGWETTNKESFNTLNSYYERINRGEYLSADDMKTYKSALDSYIDTSNRLRGLNNSYGEGFSEEEEQKWLDSLTSMQSDYDNASKYYGSFKTEQSFKDYLASVEQNKQFEAYDLDAGKLQISDWKNIYDTASGIQTDITERQNFMYTGSSGSGIEGYDNKFVIEWKNNAIGGETLEQYLQRTINERKQTLGDTLSPTGYSNIVDFEKGISEKEREYTLAERYQQDKALTDNALNAEDFEFYAQKGIEKGLESNFKRATNEHGQLELFSNVTNSMIVAYREDPSLVDKNTNLLSGHIYASEAAKFAKHMTDDEYRIYTYYLGKDEKLAEQYLESIEETINARYADILVDQVDEYGILRPVFQLSAGGAGWLPDLNNLFTDKDYYNATTAQYFQQGIQNS